MSITYEQIKEVNGTLPTTPIKGKNYVDVAARIQAFRRLFPMGRLASEYEHFTDADGRTVWVVKTFAWDNEGQLLATGLASEVEGSTNINKTSALENAETSSYGRCIGFLGIGSQTSIATASEVATAIAQQEMLEQLEKDKPMTIQVIKDLMDKADDATKQEVQNRLKGKKLEALPADVLGRMKLFLMERV